MTTEDIQALPPLNSTEREWLRVMLDRLSDVMGSSGCNDFDVTLTPESRAALGQVFNQFSDVESGEQYSDLMAAKPDGDPFVIYDFLILAHLRERLGVDE